MKWFHAASEAHQAPKQSYVQSRVIAAWQIAAEQLSFQFAAIASGAALVGTSAWPECRYLMSMF